MALSMCSQIRLTARTQVQGKALRSSAVARPAMARSARTVKVSARDAPWLPGSSAPSYLTGSMPADFGFDPLGFVRARLPPP